MKVKTLRYIALASFWLTAVIGFTLWDQGMIGDAGAWKAGKGTTDVSALAPLFWAIGIYLLVARMLWMNAINSKWKDSTFAWFMMLVVLVHVPLFMLAPLLWTKFQANYDYWLYMTAGTVLVVLTIAAIELWREHTRNHILFFSANPAPKDSPRYLQVEKEMQYLREGISFSSNFAIDVEPSVSTADFVIALESRIPAIVHFSGHGNKFGIIMQDGDDEEMLSAEYLDSIIGEQKYKLQCVVLNACHSSEYAEAISKRGIYVIGNNKPITDAGAIKFARSFYKFLSSGKRIQDAFDRARKSNWSERHTTELWYKGKKLIPMVEESS